MSFDLLHFTIEGLATFDKLTKIYNRSSISNSLNRLILLKKDFVLVFIDIDYFKKINDRYGHNIGDQVLQEFAKTVSDSVRQSDKFGRWGGEEFLLILPDTTTENAIKLVNKIRKEMNKQQFSEKKIKITASFGIANNQSKQISQDQIIHRADQAVYKAKQTGRNAIFYFKPTQKSHRIVNVTDKK